jgi:hypothetical protein
MQAEEIQVLREYYKKRIEQEKQIARDCRSRVAAKIHRQLQRLHEMMLYDVSF